MDSRAETPPEGGAIQALTGTDSMERESGPWEPILRLLARVTGARAAWLRLEDEIWVEGVAGEVADRQRARAKAASRRALYAEYLAEEAGGVSVRAMRLGAMTEAKRGLDRRVVRGEAESGSVGVLLPSGAWREEEVRAALAEVAEAVAGSRHLRRAGKRMSEADRMLTALTHAVVNLPTGVTVTDSDGRIVFTNPAEARMHGYTADELLGSPANTLAPPPAGRPEESIERAPRPRTTTGWTRESINQHRDGRRFPVLLWSDAIEEDGEFRGLVTWSQDLTPRHALEEQIRRSLNAEAIGRVASGIAHDFNNLLTTIRGLSDLLLLESGVDHGVAEDLRIIRRAADTATDLTRRLLTFSGRERGEPSPRLLFEVVREGEPILRRLVGEKVEFIVEMDPALAPILADRGEIEQVILNLVVNARDAMPAGGRLTVRARNVDAVPDPPTDPVTGALGAGPFVELSVEDTGRGIDPAILDRVFEPFFTTGQGGKGTGLGLATVYGIVRRCGGYVRIASAPGKGTTVRAWFPAYDGTMPSPGMGIAMRAPARTVLLATTDADTRELVGSALQAADYRVLIPSTLIEAHELVQTYGDRVHLLIIDAILGDAWGADEASRMRELRSDMSVLVLTSDEPPAAPPDGIEYLDALTPPDILLHFVDRLVEGSA